MSNKDSLLDVVLFASYGEKGDSVAMPGMPIEFTARNTMSFNDLSFTQSETQNMVDKWNNLEPPAGPFLDSSGETLVPKTMSDVVSLTSTVTNTIHTLASGHVGLTRFLIELIAEKFLNHKRFCVPHYPVSEREVMEYLLSKDLQQAVGESRAVPSGWDQRDQEVVRRILMEGSVKQTENKELKDSFSRLKRIGLVYLADEVMFTSPLLAMQAMDTLFGTVPGRPEEMPEFQEFLFNTVCRMNYTLLSRGKVCGVDTKGKQYNTDVMQLQMEWYSVAIGLLPKSCTPIVNYGRYHPLEIGHQNAKGEDDEKFELLDLYLNCENNKLGVDVIRNSEDLEERMKRFEAGGKYTGIALTQWKVVNFVEVRGEPESHSLKQKDSVYEGELRILWSPDSFCFVALDADGEKLSKFVSE